MTSRSGMASLLLALALLSQVRLSAAATEPLSQPVAQPIEIRLSAAWSAENALDDSQGIVVTIEMTNRADHPVEDVTVVATVPEGETAPWEDSSVSPQPDSGLWLLSSLGAGERAGPFVYRLSASDERLAPRSVRATVAWSEPEPDSVTTPELSLAGLLGEPGLTKTLLPSGLTVLTLERPDTPSVAIHIAIRAGSRDEDDTTAGGSHWLEHAHFLGTERYPAGSPQIFGAIDQLGGELNASTGSELTSYFTLVPAKDFDVALELLADILLHSTFPADAFNRERRVVFQELKRRNDNPSIRVFDLFVSTVFESSPLRRHPGGTVESVEAIPIATILSYRDERYVTGNTTIAVAGNVRHEDVIEKVEQSFGEMAYGPRHPREAVPEPAAGTQKRLDVGRGFAQAEMALGVPVPGLDSEDQYALIVMDEILDRAGRRLVSEIREKRGLASQVRTILSLDSDAGFWAARVSTTPANVEAVRELILAEMRRLKEEALSPEELQHTVRFLLGSHILSEEFNEARAARLASGEALGFLESSGHFARRLQELTPEDIQAVAQKYLDEEYYTLVVVKS